MTSNKSVFEVLNTINVNEHTEKKKSGSKKNEQTGQWEDNYLTYLSWTWAWAEVKKRYADAYYEIIMHNGLPYVYDENTGYMVFTNVTIEGITHMMWLPVMDGANKAMKRERYTYSTKSGEKSVEPATMFDVNKTIMRCLVKNLAMFGLGLYIYAGEDLPEPTPEEIQAKIEEEAKAKAELTKKLNEVAGLLKDKEIAINYVTKLYKVKDLKQLSLAQAENVIKHINDIEKKYKEDNKNE